MTDSWVFAQPPTNKTGRRSFNVLFIFIIVRRQRMYLDFQVLAAVATVHVGIIRPKGWDALLWGFILVHLSGVWLGEPNGFKLLRVFI